MPPPDRQGACQEDAVGRSNSTHPEWLLISLQADPVLHDPLISFLFDLGCTGVISEDFEDSTLRAYLPMRKDLEDIRTRIELYLQELKSIFPEAAPSVLQLTLVADQDWGLNWRRFFQPVRATPKLLILPAWIPLSKTDADAVIRMDPGPAFGTGQHPTTQMCLEAMERVPVRRPWNLLDVGTGSGILAIYGIRLGAQKVLALDTDPEAIRWAERNIRLNDVSASIRLSLGPVEELNEAFSLVCANLILGEIVRLIPFFPGLMSSEAWLILSGLLENQVQEVNASLVRHGLHVRETLRQREWVCLIATRRA